MNEFDQRIMEYTGTRLSGVGIDTIQVNVGQRCNNQCVHCHIQATPESTEMMKSATMEQTVKLIEHVQPKLIDITGGAPELHPSLTFFLHSLTNLSEKLQVRTNLTVLLDPGMSKFVNIYRDLGIKLVASLPCYLKEDVDRQRGDGVFEKSIKGLRMLNDEGYGSDPQLPLDLVFNPEYPVLPPKQSELEAKYKSELSDNFGLVFNNLITITNMPIGRWLGLLEREGKKETYLELLKTSFNPKTIEMLMCRHQISIGWDGKFYDCDFNLALGLPAIYNVPNDIQKFSPEEYIKRKIVTGPHCFGCTAGDGSSCSGALEQ